MIQNVKFRNAFQKSLKYVEICGFGYIISLLVN
jgi:hypothetical protein